MSGKVHLRFGSAPSPVRALGDGLWVKDEGAYGDGGWGGNKVRKLEHTLADALARGRRGVLTFGGLGTNHGLATALYARQVGLRCALGLVEQPVDDHVREMLSSIEDSGAVVHRFRSARAAAAAAPWLWLRHGRPYLVPVGGSSPLGVRGTIDIAREIREQAGEPDWIVVAAGSGGTAAGLLAGLAGTRTRVLAVLVNDKTRVTARGVARLAERAGGAPVDPSRLRWETGWLGPGYGHATPDGRAATEWAAQHGLRLDPVYTAKAMAALLALRERGELAGQVVFVQTDGPRPRENRADPRVQ